MMLLRRQITSSDDFIFKSEQVAHFILPEKRS
jgi:hypothetical protein